MVGLTHLGDGLHTVELSKGIHPGQWTKITLVVAGVTGIETTFVMWIGHLPGDVNGDGQFNLNDATAFARELNDDGLPDRADLNDDGQPTLSDASLFGQLWHGIGRHLRWQGRRLPPRLPQPGPRR